MSSGLFKIFHTNYSLPNLISYIYIYIYISSKHPKAMVVDYSNVKYMRNFI